MTKSITNNFSLSRENASKRYLDSYSLQDITKKRRAVDEKLLRVGTMCIFVSNS